MDWLLELLVTQVHHGLAMFPKLAALQWLAREVTDHVIRWTILDSKQPLVNAILDEIVPDVYVSGALARALHSIFL